VLLPPFLGSYPLPVLPPHHRIIQQLGQEDGSPHARATRPWASPPPVIVSPRRASGSPSPSPSPRQPYGAATELKQRALSPLGWNSHTEGRPGSTGALQKQRASSAGRVWVKSPSTRLGSSANAVVASDAAYLSMRGPAGGAHTHTTFRAAPFGVEVRGQSQAGYSSGALASDPYTQNTGGESNFRHDDSDNRGMLLCISTGAGGFSQGQQPVVGSLDDAWNNLSSSYIMSPLIWHAAWAVCAAAAVGDGNHPCMQHAVGMLFCC
jgi:hypothetical protein